MFFQSNLFTIWYKMQNPKPPGNIVDRAGRQHMQQVVEEVSRSFSSVTSALGNSARSQLPIPLPSTSTASSSQKSRSSKLTTPSKRSWEEQVFTSEQESEGLEYELQPDGQRRRYRSQEQPDRHIIEQSAELFRIDPNKFELQEYTFRGVDVGGVFLDFQRRSTRLVNRLEEKASLFNLHSFLYVYTTCDSVLWLRKELLTTVFLLMDKNRSMNYIWDMEHNLPMLSEDVFAALTTQYTGTSISLSKAEAALCWELDQELMPDWGHCRTRTNKCCIG